MSKHTEQQNNDNDAKRNLADPDNSGSLRSPATPTPSGSANASPVIPDGWVETSLGDIVELAQGVAINAKTNHVLSDKENGLPLLKINNLVNKTVDQWANPELVTPKAILKKEDVIFTRTGQVGWVFTGKIGILHNNSFKVIPSSKLNTKFLYWFLKQKIVFDYVQKVASGSAQPDLNHDAFKTIKITLPSLPEQTAIASLLSSFDNKIELLRVENATLESLAQTIFHEHFGKYSPDHPEDLPDGWRVGKLGEEFDISIGRTPPRIESKWFSNIPIGKKWISIKDIGNCGVYIFDTSEYLTNEAVEKFNIPVIPKNTTILSFKMTVGKLTVTTEEMLSNEAIAHLKIKNDSYLTTEFIYLFLQNLDFNSLGSTSSIVTAINSTMIKNLNVIIPEKSIVQKFHEKIIILFEKIKNNSQEIQTLVRSRDGLLPKLMSGQIRVK